MFKLLKNKFKLVILFVMSLSIISAALISYITIRNITFGNFVQLTNQSTNQQFKNVELYMNLIEASSKPVPDGAELLVSLESPNYDDSVPQLLDSIHVSNTHILGVSLYCTNGLIYTSNNLSIFPTLSQLKLDQSFNTFTRSSQNSKWFIRFKGITDFYINSNYLHKKEGLFSYSFKIMKKDRLLGYMLVDTDIEPLFDIFKNDGFRFIQRNNAYISTPDSLVNAYYNNISDSSLAGSITSYIKTAKKSSYTKDKKFMLSFMKIPDSDSTIITATPLNQIYSQFNSIKLIMISLSVILLGISVLINNYTLKSITIPLTDLYNKMKTPL